VARFVADAERGGYAGETEKRLRAKVRVRPGVKPAENVGWYITPAGIHHYFAGYSKGRHAVYVCACPFLPHLDKPDNGGDNKTCKHCMTYTDSQ
jgi:hypothetical protein